MVEVVRILPFPMAILLPTSEKILKSDAGAQHLQFSGIQSECSGWPNEPICRFERSHRAGDDRLNQGWYRLAVERSYDPGTIASRVVLGCRKEIFSMGSNPIHLAGEGVGDLWVRAKGFPIHRKARLA